jgi:hypothetical protein
LVLTQKDANESAGVTEPRQLCYGRCNTGFNY